MADRPAWLDEVRQPPKVIPASSHRPAPLLFDDEHRAIVTREAWDRRRVQLRVRWQSFLGTIQTPRAVAPPKVLEEDRRDGVVRLLIQYEAEPGLPVEAYLLRPEGGDPLPKSRPGAVVFHSTVDHTIRQPAGLDGPADKHIGLQLARRGFVTLCPRCFLWQYSEKGAIAGAVDWLRRRHPGVSGMAKMLSDAVRAVDLLSSLPDVNPLRIGAIGHSLGAKEVLYLAAFDTRVRPSVSSEGGITIASSNWDAPWYLGEAVRRPGFPLDHAQVLALAAPRAFLLIGGDSADGDASWPTIEAGLPVWSLLGAPDALGFFNHHQGHAFPEIAGRRSFEWLDWFLKV
jgi:dienelactone hydrolase